MPGPIYLLVLGQGWTEAWYRLSKAEQDNLWAKVEEVSDQAGEKNLIWCNSRWANEGVFDGWCSNIRTWKLIKRKLRNWKSWNGGGTFRPKRSWERRCRIKHN